MSNKNMTIKDLKKVIENIPEYYPVIIPVIDEDDSNSILAFRYIRTAGILTDNSQEDDAVLCLNTSTDDADISTQIEQSGKEVGVEKVLY